MSASTHDRRGFLRLGGMTVATSAFLVACSANESTTPGSGGSVGAARPGPSGSGTTVLQGAEAAELDASFVLTAESIEQLLVSTYQRVLDTGVAKTPAIAETFRWFQEQHRAHADRLAATAQQMGQRATGQPNAVLASALEPTVAAVEDEAGALDLAANLEDTAAQSAALAAGAFSVPPLRQLIMTIGGISARQLAVVRHLQGVNPAPTPYLSTEDAAAPDARVAASGPVTPFPSTTTTSSTTPTSSTSSTSSTSTTTG